MPIPTPLYISRSIIALAVILFFGYIFNQHIPFTGERIVSYRFDRPDGAIGVFRPSVRYELVDGEGGRKNAKVIEDPVYFDIKSIVGYTSARFEFLYQKHTAFPVQMAYKNNQSGNPFTIIPFSEEKRGDWTLAIADIDLTSAVRQNTKYTFAFSVPGLIANTTGDSVLISKLTVTLLREPFFQTLREKL